MSANLDDLAKALEFGSTYPSVSVTGQQAGAGGAPTSNLQQLVNSALQGVLGRSFRPGDHASFKAALDVSFEYTRVGDKDVYTHKPRAYPSVGASDIGGGISGAQFSLVSFAKGLHEKTQSLIDGLHSLGETTDDEELEAAKAIFSANWDEFIGELSREGGPRSSRATTLARGIFKSGPPPPPPPAGTQPIVEGPGSLVILGEELGLLAASTENDESLVGTFSFNRDRVVTIEEEGYLTNFIALTDYYFAVAKAWENYDRTFNGSDLGGGLLLIERALAVVEDAVNEVYVAMDSVNIDQPERLVITVGFSGSAEKLTVEDFLSWVHSFATREAPALIRDGGRLGIEAIKPTARKLTILTGEFIGLILPEAREQGRNGGRQTSTPPPPPLPEQFKHARVRHPLSELERYLIELEAHANSIAPTEETEAIVVDTTTETTTGTATLRSRKSSRQKKQK